MKKFACAALLSFLASSPAVAYQPGEWVLGQYKGGAHWYPGVVQSDNGNGVVVRYDDGDRETLPSSRVRSYSWRVGTRVECNFKGQGTWFPGVIARLETETLAVNYDDGDKEVTKTGRCRSR